jgi:succinate-acetate transporter protein
MANMVAERTKVSTPALANPAPLGLSAFALTTFVLSAFNAGLFTGEQIVFGLALFYGGLTQFCAGMWEFKTGNTFGATAFSSYGGFWIAFGIAVFPFFGKDATGHAISLVSSIDPTVRGQAVGFFLLGWTIFTGMMLLVTFRISGAHILLFSSLFLTFLFLTIADLNAMPDMTKYGGWLGLFTACIAWYIALSQVLAATDSPLRLPTGPIS